MKGTGNMHHRVAKPLAPAHSPSHEGEVLQEDSEAHRSEDKGMTVPLQSRWGASQPNLALLECPQTRSWDPLSHRNVKAPDLEIKTAHGQDKVR